MRLRKFVYHLMKFALMDEIIGVIYSMLAIYGIFIIINGINNTALMIAMLCLYIILVPVVYIFFAKKIKSFFKKGDAVTR